MKKFGLLIITIVISVFTIPVFAQSETALKSITESCFVKGIDDRLRCGKITVPENYEQPNGRLIPINFVILPAVKEGAQPDPLLILAGGPGQAATELTPMIARIFKRIRERRDILLIDQRGTGQSHPLSCDISHPDELVTADDDQQLAEMAKACKQQYPDTDFRQYNTVNAVRDFERVRQALGIKQLNLYGGSYGTRVGLTYLREAPEAIRTATLDAVVPNTAVIGPFGKNGSLAFQRMLEDCANSPQCNATFPTLAESYQEVMQRLNDEPVMLNGRDPLTNQPQDLLLTAGRFSSMVRMGLYSPSTRQLLPFVIDSAAEGYYKPTRGLLGSSINESTLYLGLTLSVVCSEDMPRATEQLLAEDGDNTFIGSRTADAFIELCRYWPKFDAPAAWAEPVSSDKPVLLLSGELDPVTPPQWAAKAAETLPNSIEVIAPYGGHTIAGHTCANQIVAQFVEQGSGAKLDTQCLSKEKMRPFVLNSNGAGL
ncbi:alpha/beta hydrolase [Idiomarina tyrosinivorans]|uniref:Proline iminopeptidase n=1 Tax=Idiomarina tyrosinivorans TaxID=1445662 RepID=A0A432ZR32_9GAMM|nr:alpha/beta hydrolase [Idiomarina tyrosinivorans]RUO80359.1 alpha/beta hydrolase [Idiomarina tyrosinivorans]